MEIEKSQDCHLGNEVVKEIDKLIREIKKLQVRPVLNSYIWDKDDLAQELLNIKSIIENESKK